MLLVLVGCGKEVIDSRYTGKWKLELSGIGMSDGESYKETDVSGKVSLDLDVDAAGNVKECIVMRRKVKKLMYKKTWKPLKQKIISI